MTQLQTGISKKLMRASAIIMTCIIQIKTVQLTG